MLNEYLEEDIERALGDNLRFTDAVSTAEKIPPLGIAFISLSRGAIKYLTLFKKTGRVATSKVRVTFSGPVVFDRPLSFRRIRDELPPSLKRHFDGQFSEGVTNLSDRLFRSVLDIAKNFDSSVAEDIEQLERMTHARGREYGGRGGEIVAHEKDAVSLAMRIANIDDRPLADWMPSREPAPFLRGLANVTTREDPMIARDAEVFGQWETVRRDLVGATRFRQKEHVLTIMNVNRGPLERTLGVDLILYHHTYESYVMIQYKRMLREKHGHVYRPTDSTCRAEVHRMKKVRKLLKDYEVDALKSLRSYRLNSGIFFFKLCPAELKDPFSTEMIKGMYIPLSYWESLVESRKTSGPKGGKVFTYENVPRYINTTLFVELVQSGWIGSRIECSGIITRLIQDSLSRNRSVLLADYRRNSDRGA